MRIMLDTNILISLILFPSKRFNDMFRNITSRHQLVLSSIIIEELLEVANRKFPFKVPAIEQFLSTSKYEYVYTPSRIETDLFEIRDINDYPVLYTAIKEDIDIFITGDKDFNDVFLDKPEILTPNEFMIKYC